MPWKLPEKHKKANSMVLIVKFKQQELVPLRDIEAADVHGQSLKEWYDEHHADEQFFAKIALVIKDY